MGYLMVFVERNVARNMVAKLMKTAKGLLQGEEDGLDGGLRLRLGVQGCRRVISPKQVMEMFYAIVLLGLLRLGGIECRKGFGSLKSVVYPAISCRKHTKLLTDYGGARGDGKTSNTKAFKLVVDDLSKFASDGGAQLIVPPGKWVTNAFNLTSNFTIFIQKDATILASEVKMEQLMAKVLYGGKESKRKF